METSPTPIPSASSTPATQQSSRGLFYQLQVVVVVAFLMATLFTAWTEPGLLPSSLAEKINLALGSASATEQPAALNPTDQPKLRIGIVAGHAGDTANDPGAVCPDALGGWREADINHNVATLVQQHLLEEGYNVDILDEFDVRLTGYKATALVSIHADSCDYVNDQATGYKVAAAMSTFYPEQATRLTNCIKSRYGEMTGLPYHAGSVTDDMTSYHAFGEIHNETPAAIIEVGFMNLDREILTQNQDLLARGITAGILCYVRNEDVNISPTQIP